MDLLLLSVSLKKIVILFALLDPVGLLPLFITATAGASVLDKRKFINSIAITIFIAMLISGIVGNQLLSFFGVSIGSMQVGGGLIALMISFGMILGKQNNLKQTEEEREIASSEMQIVPIAIPLLAGPAVLSFVMANSRWNTISNSITSFLPILVVTFLCWLVFYIGTKIHNKIRPEMLSLIEKLAGFLLSMLAIEMIVSGIKLLFPSIA